VSQTGLLTSTTEAIHAANKSTQDATIGLETRLFEDLGLDSLDLVAVALGLQDAHQIELDPDAVPEFVTVGDLIAELARQIESQRPSQAA